MRLGRRMPPHRNGSQNRNRQCKQEKSETRRTQFSEDLHVEAVRVANLPRRWAIPQPRKLVGSCPRAEPRMRAKVVHGYAPQSCASVSGEAEEALVQFAPRRDHDGRSAESMRKHVK